MPTNAPLVGEDLAVAYISYVNDLFSRQPNAVRRRYNETIPGPVALARTLGDDTDHTYPSKWAFAESFIHYLKSTGQWSPETAHEFTHTNAA